MEILDDIIAKRIAAVEADIIAGSFSNKDEFNAEIDRLVSVMTKTAVLKGIDKDKAEEYLQDNFSLKAIEIYERNVVPISKKDMPIDYAFAEMQKEIEELIEAGNLEEADNKIDQILSILEDEDYVKDSISNGEFTQADVDYFKTVAYPYFQELKDEQIVPEEEKQGLLQRIKNGAVFIVTGKNPYDNKTVKIKREKQSLKEKVVNSKLGEWAKKHKVAVTAVGLAAVLGAGIFIGGKFLHSRAQNASDDLDSAGQVQQQDGVAEATFEVDEEHNFNINDQMTHTEKLQLLAQAMMERGVPVVSEEECMRLGNEGKLAVSPEQLNNWLISINLEDMDELTFTKLLADSETDKEELSSDFTRVSNILGSIYTTKEENPFIYEFISNKEYSEYIKAYEEAIIQNQKGESESLVTLIKSRVYNPVAATSSGPLGMLSTSLVYQQANVYNAEVVGQDIMDLYNVNYDCKTDTTSTFYSDDWAEYMRKVNSKFEAAITYTSSEVAAYTQYILTLTDAQDDNKVYIEDQVLPYLEKNNIELGEWDVLENVENNNRQVNSQSTGGSKGSGTVSTPAEVEAVKTVSKKPETEAEKKVQQQVEADLETENRQSFEDVVDGFAASQGGIVTENKDGNLVILTPGQQPIVVDTDTKGAYDASKDYQGIIYDDYRDYMDTHRDQVDKVDGVGSVVVTDESRVTITNPNVYIDGKGNIIDKTTGDKVITGTKEEIDKILDRHPGLSEWTTVDDGRIHYSDVDDYIPQTSRTESTYTSEIGGSSVNVTVQQPIVTQPQQPSSVLDNVDQNVLGSLTSEEQAALEEMLNAGNGPVAGEIVTETYSDIVYGSYTVPQLMNNPALCKNIPESILKNQFPEIWTVYQNWLEEQKQAEESQISAHSDPQIVSSNTTIDEINAQKAALEAAKAELTGEEQSLEESEKTL